jgi:hypothetical protein
LRSVEDIQGLMGMAPKGMKPRAALMATYYAKLTQIFTKSESRLYSAYAWYRWARTPGLQGRPGCKHLHARGRLLALPAYISL